jgi:hypothetical protein
MPYHSSATPGIYHLYNDCSRGNNIEKENRAPGTRGGTLCFECAAKKAYKDTPKKQ